VKIIFFGLTLSSSWGNGHATPLRAIIRALNRQGHSVTFYEKDVSYYAQHRDLESPDFCDLRLYSDWEDVRLEALRQARESDAVISTSYLPEGAQVNEQVLALNGPLRVYYDMDTPVTLSRFQRGESPAYIRDDQLAHFDLVLSFTGGRTLDVLRQNYGVRKSAPVYGCVDPDVHLRVEPAPDLASDFLYMGTYAADRQAKLDALFFGAARELPRQKFVVVGSLFPDGLDWPMNVWYKPHAAPSSHAALYSSTLATLNITRGEMAAFGHCPSGRFFEAAACGTPIITDHFEGIEEFFDTEREVAVVHSTEDVVRTLRRSEEDLAAMASLARERTLDEHTGDVRARQLVKNLESAANKSLAEVA
jgi:spore maturation protein CgeB